MADWWAYGPLIVVVVGKPNKGKTTTAVVIAAEAQEQDGERPAVAVGDRIKPLATDGYTSVDWPRMSPSDWFADPRERAVLDMRVRDAVPYLWQVANEEPAPLSVLVFDEARAAWRGKGPAELVEDIACEYRHTHAIWIIVAHSLGQLPRELHGHADILIFHEYPYGVSNPGHDGRELRGYDASCERVGPWPVWTLDLDLCTLLNDKRMCHSGVLVHTLAGEMAFRPCSCCS